MAIVSSNSLTVFMLLAITTRTLQAGKDYSKIQPNIIYILADDLGHGDVGFTGGRIATPALDRLAKEGVQLTQHYTQSICTPSRAALMSGRYPIHLGLQHSVDAPGEPAGLPLDETLIPEVLKEYNYSTYMVGKWHLGMHKYAYTPARRGFDDFLGFYLGCVNYNTYMRGGGFDLRHDYWTGEGEFVSDLRRDLSGQYSAYLFVDYIRGIIEGAKDSDKPFFLFFSMQNIHGPHVVPQRFIDEIAHDIPDDGRGSRIVAAMVAAMDEAVGNITRSLESAGLADNTVIVFSSDNGGDVNCVRGMTSVNAPYRGGKRSLYEGGIRSPSFVWAKNRLTSGKSDALIHITDWLPTFWNLASLDGTLAPNNPVNTKQLDGVNQWPAIAHDTPSGRDEILLNIDPAPLSCCSMFPIAGIRWKQWKFILGSGGPGEWEPQYTTFANNTCYGPVTPGMELYNIETDPEERSDVAYLYPDLVRELSEKIHVYNATAVAPDNYLRDPASNPARFNFTWMPWMREDEAVTTEKRNLWDLRCKAEVDEDCL